MTELLLDTIIDCIKMLPILYLAYLLMEYIEQKAGEKLNKKVAKVGAAGPALGGLLGAIPQCGFSGAVAGFYAAGIVTLGTLIAVFLSTSDEMIPILLSSNINISVILKILLFKVLGGIIAGFIVDITLRAFHRSKKTSSEYIHEFCEREHCDCKENIFLSALKHTAKVLVLIFIVSLALNLVFYFGGENFLRSIINNTHFIGEILLGLVGLIPNCSASVLISNLFVENVITAGQMITGLMTNAGVGLLVLFRLNKNIKENLIITLLLYVFGVLFGILTGFLWW